MCPKITHGVKCTVFPGTWRLYPGSRKDLLIVTCHLEVCLRKETRPFSDCGKWCILRVNLSSLCLGRKWGPLVAHWLCVEASSDREWKKGPS